MRMWLLSGQQSADRRDLIPLPGPSANLVLVELTPATIDVHLNIRRSIECPPASTPAAGVFALLTHFLSTSHENDSLGAFSSWVDLVHGG